MDTRSEANLARVRAKLGAVIRAADQSPQPFIVTYGLRTLDAEKAAVASGHSQTLHSRHLPSTVDHMACAVDVTPLIDGEVSFAPGEEARVYGAIAAQIKAAAERLGTPLQWGGDWAEFKDWGHFQLPWLEEP